MGRRILLITTGGTISQTHDKDGTAISKGEKGARTLLSNIESKKEEYRIESITSVDAYDIDSSNLTPDRWKALCEIIIERYDEFDSFIITHGTNTLGYTCAALSFAFSKIGKPVILTGSQVPYGDFGADAEMNLENAFRVAAQQDNPLRGILAVFGSHIITGTRVKKTTEFEYDAFKTFNSNASLGRIGRVLRFEPDAVATHNSKYGIARKKYDVLCAPDFNMADIVSFTEFPGMSKHLFEGLVNLGAKGFIIRSTGAGDPNIGTEEDKFDNLREAFIYLREKKIPIIVTTQAPDGVASMNVNEPGVRARELGAIPAWDMSMESMTTKLGWLLAQGFDYYNIIRQMSENIRGELNEKLDVDDKMM